MFPNQSANRQSGMATGTIKKVMNDSGNGYCKMQDGTLICWGEFTTNRSQYSVTVNGAMYAATADVNISFPKEFVSIPSLSMLSADNSCPVMYCVTTVSKIATMQVQRHVNNGPPDGATWRYIAIGRWK